MRVVKTALCATLAIYIANYFNLVNPTAAGIVAILSVTNTKKSAFKSATSRFLSLILALLIAFICYSLLGFKIYAFGIFLLIFIPIASRLNLNDGIQVSSVLVTHFLIAKSLSIDLFLNSIYLMIIGTGLALLANLYMPNITQQLKEDQLKLEEKIRLLLYNMSNYLLGHSNSEAMMASFVEVETEFEKGVEWARQQFDNQIFKEENYYIRYFEMRNFQILRLKELIRMLQIVDSNDNNAVPLQQLIHYTAVTFGEENDGKDIMLHIDDVIEIARQQPLPISRDEFENRATLFQIIIEFKNFINLKVEFMDEET